ncbi:hypothetical protein Pan97_15280 [Bremerella volcania]|uniref:Uncharacterized protein n=1 Tax=Bremerella volcania TaxID=2527984 RepID=A0A518C5M1_9BACT|nr:hypothetical protein [Bremerella volcania]QDU74519.1 hypothetical protein Pan97_15280 [Bremerella volcania]
MPERDLTSESVVPNSGKSWGLRFSLGAMMVIVALFAGVFGYLSYFRSARCLLSYQVTTLSAEDVDGLKLDFHAIDGSPYRWAFDQEDAIAELTRQRRQIEPPLYEKQLTVAYWPRLADSYTYIRPTTINSATSPFPDYKSGEFAGFWGVRKAGGRLMFRVEAQTSHRQPRVANVEDVSNGRFDEVSGTLAYEGKFPTSKLIFAAPMGNGQVHLFLIQTEEVSAKEPFVHRPGPIDSLENQPDSTTEQHDPQPEAAHNDE